MYITLNNIHHFNVLLTRKVQILVDNEFILCLIFF